MDEVYTRTVIERTAQALRRSLASPRKVTHVGTGLARVEKVASNRRLLGPDFRVKLMRWSSSRIPEAIAAPEGLIDPYLRVVGLFDEQTPIVVLSYYATHPQSYYGQGDVTCEFVGIARNARDEALPGVLHVHFNGAGGNIAAGKYNDGSKPRRPVLAKRMEEGMRRAWESVRRVPISADDVEWRVRQVSLPLASHLNEQALRAVLDDPKQSLRNRFAAADDLAWLLRCRSGKPVDVACLRLGDVYILHMPGELFVEYQLTAQWMRPDSFVCMAAYGEYGPGYIGTRVAYHQGGYETSAWSSNVAPEVEAVLLRTMRELLK